jgi:aminoglycoside phosphotransferase
MRVSLPVDPFFKTESEAATLAYVGRHTSIPVPKVIAYDSSSNSKLGFEWMLLEKIEGVPLSSIWEKMPFDSKVSLTVEITNLQAQLDNLHFTQIGSLYFSTIRSQVNSRIASFDDSHKKMNVDRDIGTDFVIGRMVSPWFFRDKLSGVNQDTDINM